MALSRKLWTASGPETLLTKFRIKIEKEEGVSLPDYDSFHHWSIVHLESFWSLWAKESGFIFHKAPDRILQRSDKFWESKWFVGAELNFAENLLEKGKPEDIAILYLGEDGKKETFTYSQLKSEVFKLASYFKTLGVSKGDRVCGLVPNAPVSTIGMLATTSLGAIWSSASPDFGAKGILDRFEQIQPKVLFAVDGYFFKGKKISILDKVGEVSAKLASFADYKSTILSSFTGDSFLLDGITKPIRYDDLPKEENAKPNYESISFQDPVYIMFSSGTTGLPKCIVQGAGVLLNHTKELALHANLHAGEKLFYYTTCGWMMWNWSQSALALGATLCQYDGNPFHPDWKTLWRFAEEEEIQVFGTSAKYLSVMEQDGVEPIGEFPLSKLKTILSTGSPLYPSGFRYVYSKIKKDVQLASISGGTDLNGCFALGNPDLPVFEGEIQSRGLGMDVKVFNENGQPVEKEKGELVCESPFPSMPLFFWNDKDGSKYQSAYFSRFENIWCHGDFAELTENKGMIIYGRSDATLNPGGVRIGTADIYSVVETFSEIQDSVIIGQEYKEDVRIVLFLKMKEGRKLEDELKSRLKDAIRSETSPRHVPALILEVKDIPYTVNGKKVEIAVRQTVQGETVKNSNALANPESLSYFKDIPELK
ncbi:acetoacetyl-CoA synthetase [Leptospira kobayashii]|uniref:Acetoacetyl-CoA synthetase n=1 Tax=Leptospira kobayashii TaxID=1917830 RepID=A0ABM7UQG4_9LEPT|nr:acetoacetate--CoA ligase [Leptospira kobayashii]BDA77397.1 acetoacetyl-CoA synthetase [Leptospira kobayashii]